ncbi:MAG TPA: hypothetical protein VFE58_12550 [Tepidisphaeraceae bacterium]|nr:hypothetical protein [Tepidisphaeraceae bacterium]
MDFEERRLGNAEDLPMHWLKVEGTNLPHYVNGRLSTDMHHSGEYSFKFDLNGGGLIYRYDWKQLPVQPGAHYRVDCVVKTTALPNARARLSAYFVNVDGMRLPDSVRQSELYAATSEEDPWHPFSIELSAEDPSAAYLVLELGLLQPALYLPASLGQRTLYKQDIHGTAWFDDVVVSQVPKITLTTDRPGNIFRRGEQVKLNVLVNDRNTDDLSAQLVIRNAAGQVVYQRTGALNMADAEPAGPLQKRMTLPLPEDLKPGWYDAAIVMTSQSTYVGQQSIDLVLLADDRVVVDPDPRFGIIATELPFDGWSELPQILPYLSAGRVKLAVWSENSDIKQTDSQQFNQLLERLQELGITPTACLVDVPPQMAAHLKPPTWEGILKAKDEDWQPFLAHLIAKHANHLDRWQLGPDNTDAFVTNPAMRQVYAKVYKQFAALVENPDLAMPWPAWYELGGELPATVALSVPSTVLPWQIPLYMQDMKRSDNHHLSLSLGLLEANQYGRDVQIRDLAQRVIYALSADAGRIDIPLPFTVHKEGNTIVKQPKELLMIVRTLTTTLSGAVFRGKVPVADGVDAFLFDKSGVGILALWDRGSVAGVKTLEMNTGPNPMMVDLWGNATPLLTSTEDRESGKLKMPIGTMPIFLIDVDGQLAQFRASVGFDRPLVESTFEPHTRKLRFSNPYKQAISGMVKLKAPSGWVVSPPTMTFNLNPGETFEREVSIEFPYNSLAGQKEIPAIFQVQADRTSSFTVPIPIQLGLSDVGMQTIATRDGKDIVIQQVISNYGDKPIDYSAFALFPGQARQERLVTNLAAGKSTIKRYRFTNITITKGMKARVGLKELEGTRILNDEVLIQ